MIKRESRRMRKKIFSRTAKKTNSKNFIRSIRGGGPKI